MKLERYKSKFNEIENNPEYVKKVLEDFFGKNQDVSSIIENDIKNGQSFDKLNTICKKYLDQDSDFFKDETLDMNNGGYQLNSKYFQEKSKIISGITHKEISLITSLIDSICYDLGD